MKKNVLLIAFGLGFLAFLFYASSSGAAASQEADRTGSPVASGTCANCHSGGNFNTEVSAQVLDGETAVTAYEPGKQYTFTVSISASNNPSAYGFQSVALTADNSNAGSFGTAPDGTQVETLNDRQYFEHSTRSDSSSWSIEWTAPAVGTGDVKFYAAGNAVNRANGSGGDSPDILDMPLTLTENVVSNTAAIEQLDLRMRVFPNPVEDVLNLQVEGSENGRFQLRLLNTAGQLIQTDQIEVVNGYANQQLQVHDLPGGHYFLHLTNGRQLKTMGIVKK